MRMHVLVYIEHSLTQALMHVVVLFQSKILSNIILFVRI